MSTLNFIRTVEIVGSKDVFLPIPDKDVRRSSRTEWASDVTGVRMRGSQVKTGVWISTERYDLLLYVMPRSRMPRVVYRVKGTRTDV